MSEHEIQHCLELVRQDGLAIEHIADPTDEICLEQSGKVRGRSSLYRIRRKNFVWKRLQECGVALGAVRDKSVPSVWQRSARTAWRWDLYRREVKSFVWKL